MSLRRCFLSLLGVALLTGCTAGSPPPPAAYTAPPVDPPDPAAVRAAGLDPCPSSDPEVPPRDDGLPPATLPCLGAGPAVTLSGLRGTPMVVNAWAQFCAPCREEMPALQDLYERAAGRVTVLGVNYKDNPSWGLEFAAEQGVTYPSVYDADGESGLLRGMALPETLFVDAEGRIVHREVGGVEPEQLLALVREHLGVRL